MKVSVSGELSLSDSERRLFGLLGAVVGRLGSEGEARVVLRVAGGWVRDKLLGKECHDVDVTVEGCAVHRLTQCACAMAADGENGKKTYAVMEPNPEYGKHVATCNATLCDISVDFVELQRSPLYDAQLRDLTINALFYNINENRVEDATQLGITDLREGILRTPVAPEQTLNYDPLRCVRVARFAAATGYRVHDDLKHAMSTEAFRMALARRTKRDRIGQELKKMLNMRTASVGIGLLAESGLFDVVFLGSDGAAAQRGGLAFAAWKRSQQLERTLESYSAQIEGLQSAYLACCLWQLDPKEGGDKMNAVYQTIMGALRMSHQDAQDAVVVARAARELQELAQRREMSRVALGRCLRKAGELWSVAWYVAVADVIASGNGHVPTLEEVRQAIISHGLEGCWRLRPLLNGNDIARVLKIEPGKIFALLLEKLMDQQLKYPEMSLQEAEAWLKNVYESEVMRK